MARFLVLIVILAMIALSGCVDEDAQDAGAIDPSEDEDATIPQSQFADPEVQYHNGSVEPRVRVVNEEGAKFQFDFPRKPSSAVFELNLTDAPTVGYFLTIYASNREEPVWSTDLTDQRELVVHLFDVEPPYVVQLRPWQLEVGFEFRASMTQFHADETKSGDEAAPDSRASPARAKH